MCVRASVSVSLCVCSRLLMVQRERTRGIGFRANSGLSAHKCLLIMMIERLAHVTNFD